MAEASATILVIDDEEQIRRALASILKSHGYRVITAATGAEGTAAAADGNPELVVLDLSLPDVDGIALAAELRTWLKVPILVLSVRSGDDDKIAALDAGADDYLTKPFSAGELLARVRALLRRSATGTGSTSVIVAGDLSIDLGRRHVTRGDEVVSLTKTEFDILAFLAANPDRVLTSHMILEKVWGPEYVEDRQTLRVHISHLRKKIEPHPSVPRYILTEPGVGFLFSTR
ncbi:MAG: response regulator [Actinomycetota bacterium]|nr:response regulator [Actinomycetota bacterium]MDP3631006.1 response regulator [Actinomycetota bacterium]